jgi:putative tryptophan/tyrosine transport system substrate-binding protein
MRRRDFIGIVGGAAAWPLAARAQQTSGRVWRIGFLGSTPPTPAMVSALRDGLRERGYVDGQNLSLDVRWLLDENPNVATELVRSGVDLIVTWATPATIAAKRATTTTPIVMVSNADPVGAGLVAELARPGGNITGTSNMATDLSGKLVQLLIEIVPGTKRVGVVRNPNNPGTALSLRMTAESIRALGLEIEHVDAEAAEELESAFARMSEKGVGGVVVIAEPAYIKHRVRIAELALKARLPTVFQRRENVEAGGLLSYGPNLSDLLRQGANFVDRILKGARPSELPVEQPTKFTLAINLKTAKALGLDFPPTLLARADEVIE